MSQNLIFINETDQIQHRQYNIKFSLPRVEVLVHVLIQNRRLEYPKWTKLRERV